MSVDYIQSSVKDFFARIDDMEIKLQNFSSDINERRENVFDHLRNFAEDSKKHLPELNSDSNEIEKALYQSMQTVQEVISKWQQQIEANKKGTEFMDKHEKYLVVMVFGAVKAGKSSLGNFFAGMDLLDADFENEYKSHPVAVFETEDKKRENGGIVENERTGRRCFKEGVLDTTGDIQYFTLSGLRWMDSPGTGAVAKSTDRQDGRTMDDMVNEYIPYTDMCIFLMNSSEPGLQEDMKYIRQLNKENQTALVVITKSDKAEEDEDEDGNIIKVWEPKDADTRRIQEEHICAQIKNSCPEVPTYKYSAISVSTYLAKAGIKEHDDEKYRGGNIDTLMKCISDKVGNNVIELKEKKPKKNVNAFIDNIINDTAVTSDGARQDIKGLRDQFIIIKNEIAKHKKKLEDKKDVIRRRIQREIESTVRGNIRKWSDEVEGKNTSLTDSEIADRIIKIVNPIITKDLNLAIGEVIKGYQDQTISTLEFNLTGGGLHNETKEITESYEVPYCYERSADGIWENIRSFFGKKYYSSGVRTEISTKVIALGTNVEGYIEKISPAINDVLSSHIEQNIDNIKDKYFAPQEQFADIMMKKLVNLENDLRNMRFDVED